MEKTPFIHTEQPVKDFEELVLTKLKLRAMTGLTGVVFRDVKIREQVAEMVADDLYTVATDMLVAAKETIEEGATVRYPTNWWEHIKARLGLKHRTIEVVTRTTIYHVCPHLPLPACDRGSHFHWLLAKGEFYEGKG